MIDYNTYMQTAAAIGSAVAAILAAFVAKKALDFQKSAALKQATLSQIVVVMQHLHYLKSLTDQVALAVDDRIFAALPQRISNIRDSVVALQAMMTTKDAQAEVDRVLEIVFGLSENNIFTSEQSSQNRECAKRLNDAIDGLHRIYSMEIR